MTMPSSGDSTTVGVGTPTSGWRADPDATPIGGSVGRYVVLEHLGQGGMGRVLRAYDPELQREVAVKEVRRALLGSDGASRLVAEARAMAKLSHPNVVAVFDVETLESGEFAIVMEYVAGGTLRDWLQAQQWPWRRVVDRFVDAARGLAAAHAVGLLHRDFKPANVLVGETTSTATTKVTDFGLARAAGHRSGDPRAPGPSNLDDTVTADGVVMGTPRYMAPEQHEARALTPAADQYAFCVALWEAVCGAPPFTGESLAAAKREGPPRWPDVSVPGPVSEAIRRGLAPAPDARWPSMDALLDALADDPAARRRRWFAVTGAIGVFGLAGVGVMAWSQAQGRRCSGAAQQIATVWDDARRGELEAAILGVGASYGAAVWERTAERLDEYAEGWTRMYTDACEATTMRGEQSAAVMDLRMACLQRAKIEMSAAVTVLTHADANVVDRAHQVTDQLPPLRRCADVAGLQADVAPPDTDDTERVEAGRARLAEAQAELAAGRYDRARKALDAAGEAFAATDYAPVEAERGYLEGRLLDAEGDWDGAARSLEAAIESAGLSHRPELVGQIAAQLIHTVGHNQRRFAEGMRYVPVARGLARDPEAKAVVDSNVGTIFVAQGKFAEAEASYRSARSVLEAEFGPAHPLLLQIANNLAIVLSDQGNFEKARREYALVMDQWESVLGPDHPQVATVRSNLATVLSDQGKYEEAEAEHRRALAAWENVGGPEHPHAAASRNNLAGVLYALGRFDEAEVEQRRALEIWEETIGPEHPHVAMSRSNLAALLFERGRFAEAEAEIRQVLEMRERVLGPEHPDVAMSHSNLAIALQHRGAAAEAESEFRRALAAREASRGDDHPETAESRSLLAEQLLERGELVESLALAERAWQRRQRDDIPAHDQAHGAFVLARILGETGNDRRRARTLAERALAAWDAAAEGYASEPSRGAVEQWLRTHPAP